MQGNISYDINRTRIHNNVIIRQYIINGKIPLASLTKFTIILNSENGSLIRQTIASLNKSDAFKFTFLQGFNDNTIFPGEIVVSMVNVKAIE